MINYLTRSQYLRLILLALFFSQYLSSCSNKRENCDIIDAQYHIFYERLIDQYVDIYSSKPYDHSQVITKVEILDKLINFNNQVIASNAEGFDRETGDFLNSCKPILEIKPEIKSFYINDLKQLLDRLDESNVSSKRFKLMIKNFFENEKTENEKSLYYIIDYDIPTGVYHQLLSQLIVEVMFVDLGLNYQHDSIPSQSALSEGNTD